MGDAIPLQHGANQFSLSVIKGKPVPLETASAKFEPASLAVTQSVRHNPFIYSQHDNTSNPANPLPAALLDVIPRVVSARGICFTLLFSSLLFSSLLFSSLLFSSPAAPPGSGFWYSGLGLIFLNVVPGFSPAGAPGSGLWYPGLGVAFRCFPPRPPALRFSLTTTYLQ